MSSPSLIFDKMIISRLDGGLGNQLFQYAAGRRLAWKNNTVLKLDISSLQNNPLRSYELHNFEIRAEIATAEECKRAKKGKGRLFGRFAGRLFPSSPYVCERHFHFDPAFLHLGDNVYLDGYWQSEKYFADCSDMIRAELRIKPPASEGNRLLLRQIQNSEAVAAHVRRGDYVENLVSNQFHGVCPLEYYQEAARLIAEKVCEPFFYIFSDDPEWVKGNVIFDWPTKIVDINPPSFAFEDLRLVQACKHFILANSSFSWWGAWLSANRAKIVIAPRCWFRDLRINTEDLLPDSWIRL